MSKLKERLAAISGLIPAESRRLIDVGCDHGLLSLAFLQAEPRRRLALLIDKREGPLEAAGRNLAAFTERGQAVLSLSDGLEAWAPEPHDTVVIAGMGGMEILSILQRLAARVSLNEAQYNIPAVFIFQAMRDHELLRSALREVGIRADKQVFCRDRGRVYAIDRCRFAPSELEAIRRIERTDCLEDWLGDCFFSSENKGQNKAVYVKQRLKAARNEAKGLDGAEADSRAALLSRLEEMEKLYEA